MSEPALPIVVSDISVEHVPFLRDSWQRSFTMDNTRQRALREKRVQAQLLELASDPTSIFKVAHFETSPDIVLGWGAARGGVLYYLYTLGRYRRRGVARQVLAHLGFTAFPIPCMNCTRVARKIATSHPNSLEFQHGPQKNKAANRARSSNRRSQRPRAEAGELRQ